MVVACSLLVIVVLAVVALAHYAPAASMRAAPGIDDAAWIDRFSLERYRPLLRLTAGEDAAFVRRELGPDAAKAYQRLRNSVVQDYIRSLSKDFNRLHRIAIDRAVVSGAEQGNLSVALVEQQLTFIFNLWTIEARLFLNRFIPCTVRLDPMLAYLDTLAADTRRMMKPSLSYRVI